MADTSRELLANEYLEKQKRGVYVLGAVFAVCAILGILLDIFIGSATGGNLTSLPQNAAERFAQLQNNIWLGLYNLDLLNIINQIIMIPAYFALLIAVKGKSLYAKLAFAVFLVGTTIFVATNTALPMFELSKRYAEASALDQKALFASAGEAMLARGAHGSMGVFIGFILPNIAGFIMSLAMLKSRVFGKVTSWLGICGNVLISVYVILVTFVPSVKSMATLFAMPGGLMLLAWMIMFAVKLFALGTGKQS
jgi:hypothetical protein